MVQSPWTARYRQWRTLLTQERILGLLGPIFRNSILEAQNSADRVGAERVFLGKSRLRRGAGEKNRPSFVREWSQ